MCLRLISSTFGAEVKEYKQDYWWRNIREKVSFHHALELLNFTDIFVERLPHLLQYICLNNLMVSKYEKKNFKDELLQLNRTQFPSLEIFVSKKVGNGKN